MDTNPSVSGSGRLLPGLQSAIFSPYITTIGLYDDNKKLIMVGRLSQPVKKSNKLPLVIKMRYDY